MYYAIKPVWISSSFKRIYNNDDNIIEFNEKNEIIRVFNYITNKEVKNIEKYKEYRGYSINKLKENEIEKNIRVSVGTKANGFYYFESIKGAIIAKIIINNKIKILINEKKKLLIDIIKEIEENKFLINFENENPEYFL